MFIVNIIVVVAIVDLTSLFVHNYCIKTPFFTNKRPIPSFQHQIEFSVTVEKNCFDDFFYILHSSSFYILMIYKYQNGLV